MRRLSPSRIVVLLVFIGFALADVAWYLINQPPPSDASGLELADYALELVPAIVAILLPAVLLIRHPEAVREAPILLFGTLLFAVVQGLVILNAELQDLFATLTPASADLPFLVPSATVFNIFVSVVTAFAVGYIAVGLGQARQHDDTGRMAGLTTVFVPVAAVFATVVGTVAVSQVDLSGASMSPELFLYLAVSVVLGVVRISIWSYLLAVATRGLLAHERPRPGWALAAAGAALIILAIALVNLGGVVALPDPNVNLAYGYLIVLAYGLGHVGLFVAFALGLPAFHEPDSDA